MSEQPRTAIVTGAGKRVGAEIARALIAKGWTVLAHVRHEKECIPGAASLVAASLEEPNSAEAIFAAAATLPPVRLLVNNAARFAFDGAEEFDAAEFDAHMAVNLRAPLLLARQMAARHEGGDAAIVNILDSKVSAPNPDFLSYTLSKQGLAAATLLLAKALAPRGIRVNAVAPGLMLQSPGQSLENFHLFHARNPLGKGVEPADVAEAVLFLASANKVTGQIITVDAGHHFLQLERDVQFLGDQ